MILSDQQIKEFQELYFKEYGKEISFEEASDRATRLIGLYKAVYLSNNIKN